MTELSLRAHPSPGSLCPIGPSCAAALLLGIPGPHHEDFWEGKGKAKGFIKGTPRDRMRFANRRQKGVVVTQVAPGWSASPASVTASRSAVPFPASSRK